MSHLLRAPPLVLAGLVRALEAQATWSPERRTVWTDRRLRGRIRLARRVAAWSGRIPSSARGLSELSQVPTSQRSDLTDPAAWADPRIPRALLRAASSSGSTGRPVTVLRDPSSVLAEEAFVRRHLRAFGATGAEPVISLRADGHLDPAAPVFWTDPSRRDTVAVPASRLDDRATRAIVARGVACGVGILRGYPSALLELARRIEDLDLGATLARWPLRVLHTSSETLSEGAEARLRAVFGVPVADHYGQVERALLIQSCPAGARHLVTDYAVPEVIAGQWAGTPLFGRGAVLLRYLTGDDAGDRTDGPCPCGWTFPIVPRVSGRADDVVVTTDGRRIGRLGPAWGSLRGIEQVQVEQTDPDRLLVRVLPKDAPTELLARLEARLEALLADPGMTLVLEPAEPVRGPGGKVRAVLGLGA